MFETSRSRAVVLKLLRSTSPWSDAVLKSNALSGEHPRRESRGGRLGGLESVVSCPAGPGQSPNQKRSLAYFVGHITLLFAPICRCFEFVKQCFMSHLGARFGGNCTPPRHKTASGYGSLALFIMI